MSRVTVPRCPYEIFQYQLCVAMLDRSGTGSSLVPDGIRALTAALGMMPSKTLKAGVHGVPGGVNMLRHRNGAVRYFTVRELARLQTFPDTWSFSGNWVG